MRKQSYKDPDTYFTPEVMEQLDTIAKQNYYGKIEATILRNLVFNEEYSKKVIPFIEPDYFEQIQTKRSSLKRLLSSLSISIIMQSQLKHFQLK